MLCRGLADRLSRCWVPWSSLWNTMFQVVPATLLRVAPQGVLKRRRPVMERKLTNA